MSEQNDDEERSSATRGRGELKKARLTEVPPSGSRVVLEKLVDHSVEVHETSVLPQIVLGLEKEGVGESIRACDGDLLGTNERAHDFDVVSEAWDKRKRGRRSQERSREALELRVEVDSLLTVTTL